MKGLELIEKYPLAAKVIKDWFLIQMIESLKSEAIDEEFKNFMREQGVEDDKMGTLIELNPRMLFDVFDDNDIIISISYSSKFMIAINGFDYGERYKTRKEAELYAIEAAFEILEEKLKPIELPNLKNDENE
tara:strand:+ start:742 stop:1137 length:396 start_codon:yes stop_codon:yes gene_type:complete